jgi:hypothetical protein
VRTLWRCGLFLLVMFPLKFSGLQMDVNYLDQTHVVVYSVIIIFLMLIVLIYLIYTLFD